MPIVKSITYDALFEAHTYATYKLIYFLVFVTRFCVVYEISVFLILTILCDAHRQLPTDSCPHRYLPYDCTWGVTRFIFVCRCTFKLKLPE